MRTRESDERWSRGVLLLGVVICPAAALGFLLPPLDMPASGAPAGAFASYYEDERTPLLALCYLATLTMALLVPVFDVLRRRLARTAPELAGVGFAAALLTLAMTILGPVLFAAAAYRQPAPETARALTDVGWTAINMAAGPPTFVSIVAYALALRQSPYARPGLTAFSLFVAVAHLIVAGAFADDGFLSLEGGIAYAVPVLWFLWITATCLALLRERGGDGTRRDAPGP